MSAQPICQLDKPFFSDTERKAIIDELEFWAAMVLARSSHGHADVRVRLDLKDRRMVGIRGGGEASRAGRGLTPAGEKA